MNRRLLMGLLMLFITHIALAQTGAISGTVTDKKTAEPILGAIVAVFQNGVVKGGAQTDIDGRYMIKPLQPGDDYELRVKMQTYKEHRITKVLISPDRTTYQNVTLHENTNALQEVIVTEYTVPLIKEDEPGSQTTITAEQIQRLSHRSAVDAASLQGGVHQSQSTSNVSIAGSRASGTIYIIDGIQVRGTSSTVHTPEPIESRAGKLTSGEVNDFNKWKLWGDLANKELRQWRSVWQIQPMKRYTVQVVSQDNTPVANATVVLRKRSDGSIIWEAKTDNTGKAELWKDLYQDTKDDKLSIDIQCNNASYTIRNVRRFSDHINTLQIPVTCSRVDKLDVAFLVDATGSMSDEIEYLKEELKDIIMRTKDSLTDLSLRLDSVFYRDYGDDYITKVSHFDSNINTSLQFINDNDAGGGAGPRNEAVDSALGAAFYKMDWREDALKIAFIILDAPPHENAETLAKLKDMTEKYARRGIRLVPVACSGSGKITEYIMRSMALATNGTYLFLTDHSGIGDSHTVASTDKYDVQYINDLIFKVIYQFSYMPNCEPAPLTLSDTLTVSNETPKDSAVIAQANQKQAEDVSWKYYPNPTAEKLYIEYTGLKGDYYITDISGKAIIKKQADRSGRSEVDMSQFPSGVYFIRYQTSPDNWMSGKFVVIH